MASPPKKGSKVKWDAAQGQVEGTVEKVVTGTTRIKGHTAHASKEAPQVVVKSDKTGKAAVHKPDELKPR